MRYGGQARPHQPRPVGGCPTTRGDDATGDAMIDPRPIRSGLLVPALVQSLTDGTSGLVETGAVHGRTGRFAGATGGFDVVGVNGQVTYGGWIVYDASNRRAF